VFKFYQFWLNVDDEGVISYMKVYTTLGKAEIDKVAAEFEQDKSSRIAQKRLAYEVTKLVHGGDKADAAVHASEVLFGQRQFSELSNKEIDVLRGELMSVQAGDDIYQVLVDTKLASSKSEARTFVASGAVSVNGQKITPDSTDVFKADVSLVKRGKNSFALVG
jgi:tyrosyl-tRNA synthetase